MTADRLKVSWRIQYSQEVNYIYNLKKKGKKFIILMEELSDLIRCI